MTQGVEGSPQLALDHLDPNRITFARELRSLTKKELADKISKTPSAVTQFEQGALKPDLETFARIALALGLPTSFFMKHRRAANRIRLDACNFRALRSATQRERRQSTRIGELTLDLMSLLEKKGVVFPQERVSRFACSAETDEEVEQIASDLRRQWGMGFGPIPNMVKLLESQGVFVLPIYDACEKVDAYSTWVGTRPSIMLALNKTASRARFDAGHELGHLVLHEDAVPGDHTTESQANRFAGAFLVPREGFLEECPRQWSLAAFQMLKFRWKVAIQALVRRAYDLGQLSQSSYRRAYIEINSRGMRQDEGPEWEHEQPTLVAQALRLLQSSLTLEAIAAEISLSVQDLKSILRRCIPDELLQALDRKGDDAVEAVVHLQTTPFRNRSGDKKGERR